MVKHTLYFHTDGQQIDLVIQYEFEKESVPKEYQINRTTFVLKELSRIIHSDMIIYLYAYYESK